MSSIEVLKFGSSVLRTAKDLRVAVDEIYRRWRSGFRVIAVVSAFEGVTDALIAEVTAAVGADCPEATASYVATGELRTAALLLGSLRQHGLPARLIEPREIGLIAEGSSLESTPIRLDVPSLERLWEAHGILVLPGYYGIDAQGRVALFGRGGSDLSALFLAAQLKSGCRLLKDVAGVFDQDPAASTHAHRFSTLSWERAARVAGPLIQSKALHFAQLSDLPFGVGRPNEVAATLVGHTHDEWATSRNSGSPPTHWAGSAGSSTSSPPLRIALLGCGVVGRGVYEALKCYPSVFDIRHVLVRNIDHYRDVAGVTADAKVVSTSAADIVIDAMGGVSLAYAITVTALAAGKFVVSANKAAIASHGKALARYTREPNRRLWYSAAVGGALPVLETLTKLKSHIREIRGIVNGTCGVVLDAWAQGKTRHDAVLLAQAQGFAESNPVRDLSGQDSADKLSLMIEAGFGDWIDPQEISMQGIDAIIGDPTGYKLIARARYERGTGPAGPRIVASVGPERPPPGSFLGQARGPENRVEIELTSGDVIRLRAQGAGRWPTTVSVLGDLHDVARLIEQSGDAPIAQRITSIA